MMRYIALILCLMLLAVLPASAEAESCYSRENAPYWHKNADCHFAETDWMDVGILGGETRALEVNQAESEGQKPCDMVEDDGWPRGVVELPADVLKTWGAPDEKLYDMFPDAGDFEEGGKTVYPDDYAGVFINVCGGCTILLVDPSIERVSEWRELLQGEFWVLSARYSYNELKVLARAVSNRILTDDSERRARGETSYYHIVSVSVSQIANVVQIGVLPDGFDEGVQRIREALADAGYSDPCMLRFVPANYPSWL